MFKHRNTEFYIYFQYIFKGNSDNVTEYAVFFYGIPNQL